MRVVHDMHEDREAVVKCAVGVTDGFDLDQHQGSALCPVLFAMKMDRLDQ